MHLGKFRPTSECSQEFENLSFIVFYQTAFRCEYDEFIQTILRYRLKTSEKYADYEVSYRLPYRAILMGLIKYTTAHGLPHIHWASGKEKHGGLRPPKVKSTVV